MDACDSLRAAGVPGCQAHGDPLLRDPLAEPPWRG